MNNQRNYGDFVDILVDDFATRFANTATEPQGSGESSGQRQGRPANASDRVSRPTHVSTTSAKVTR